ncbi:hypothetical protein [Amycolatopsis sp. SID8362]|nr:hypothetical protein [Amycolatopsis sp. SID8362]
MPVDVWPVSPSFAAELRVDLSDFVDDLPSRTVVEPGDLGE